MSQKGRGRQVLGPTQRRGGEGGGVKVHWIGCMDMALNFLTNTKTAALCDDCKELIFGDLSSSSQASVL